jgi:hypothetical protein
MKEELRGRGGGGWGSVFQIFFTIIKMAALSTIHDRYCRSRDIGAIYTPCDIYVLERLVSLLTKTLADTTVPRGKKVDIYAGLTKALGEVGLLVDKDLGRCHCANGWGGGWEEG